MKTTWDDTPERNAEELEARKRVTHRWDGSVPGCVPAPHDLTLAEIADRAKQNMVIK
jgi:hypothetical protein